MQINELFTQFDTLHQKHGSKQLTSIYGAGETNSPNICLIFMNPTARNVSSELNWNGIKAPWLGTKNVWRLLYKLGLLDNQEIVNQILAMRPEEWTIEFSENLYKEIAKKSIYITNIAKCTQENAKHLPDSVYKEYLPLMIEELSILKPKLVIALGNQVSSVLLQKPISVSKYINDEFENLELKDKGTIRVYPSYYPIGQGTPHMPKAIERINRILDVQGF
jgi:DNA polymerase